jgi:6-phosphofructokinase 1
VTSAPITSTDTRVRRLGPCGIESPLAPAFPSWADGEVVDELDRVLVDDTPRLVRDRGVAVEDLPGFEQARPARHLYFDPATVGVGIVTCGGLCPGLNDVVRGLVQELRRHYGVRRIMGLRDGYRGLTAAHRDSAVELSGSLVREIDRSGGTFLGTSRGPQDPEEMLESLRVLGLDVLLVVGGDGTMRGARGLAQEARRQGADLAVVGVPKTIDNDLPFIDQSFGFRTAVREAAAVVRAAHAEAHSVEHGVSIVKLMGRHSGFIACHAALAVGDVDFVLVPEVPFTLDGPYGLLERTAETVRRRGQVVIVVAEGAGQDLVDGEGEDASGNTAFGDVGELLAARVPEHLEQAGLSPTLRYLDPSYAIRSVPADTFDSIYCTQLAHAAVHAAMAGRTEAVVAQYRGRMVLVPMALATSTRNQVDPDGVLWTSVLEATRQPTRFDETGVLIGPADEG